MKHSISSKKLSVRKACKVALQGQIDLSKQAIDNIQNCRTYLDKKLATNQQAIYGINTGFGHMCDVIINKSELQSLQKNLLLSHSCGMGDEVPSKIVRLMLLLKIQSLSYGHSGVQVSTVERLFYFFNHHILPIVYQQGSLGASGDLAPLSHLSLPLIGLGEVYYKGQKKATKKVLKKLNLKPLKLQSKEGLALINGTQFMSAYGIWCLNKAKYLAKLVDLLATLSLEAYDGRIDPFHSLIHQVRKQKGQAKSAARIRRFLKGSQLIEQPKKHVQDPYSFRCIPQVHGASLDAIQYVNTIFEREINSVTDNPNIFIDEDTIISGGNFHGQPLAIALDMLAIALAELGSISERRTYKLTGGERNLPPILMENAGLQSGFLIPQYTAASIVSQNKQLCTPASIDSITSSNGQEDHVSMGANAATKCYRVVQNLEKILAIELFTAAQAFDFRKKYSGLNSSPIIEKMMSAYRKEVPFLKKDDLLHTHMQNSIQFIRQKMPKYL